jgi:hypothetical protein
MRHLNKSKILAISLMSGLMLALAANPAKAGDLSIGIGLNLGYPGYYNSYYPDRYVIHYRDYDRHHYYHDRKNHKHWKQHKKHWKHHDKHYRGHTKHHYRHHDRHSYRHHDRYDRDYRHHPYYR